MTHPRESLAALIERVLASEVSARVALQEIAALFIPEPNHRDRVFEDAWHALMHYREDEDIRARDADHAEWQREDLRRWVNRLRQKPGSVLGL